MQSANASPRLVFTRDKAWRLLSGPFYLRGGVCCAACYEPIEAGEAAMRSERPEEVPGEGEDYVHRGCVRSYVEVWPRRTREESPVCPWRRPPCPTGFACRTPWRRRPWRA